MLRVRECVYVYNDCVCVSFGVIAFDVQIVSFLLGNVVCVFCRKKPRVQTHTFMHTARTQYAHFHHVVHAVHVNEGECMFLFRHLFTVSPHSRTRVYSSFYYPITGLPANIL